VYRNDRGKWRPIWDLPGSLEQAGARFSKVVGVTYYPGLHSPRAGAGWWLRLIREPDNPHGQRTESGISTAIAVYTDDGVEIGHLPSEITWDIYADARLRDTDLGAVVVTEYRLKETQERTGIRVLVGPSPVWAEWDQPA